MHNRVASEHHEFTCDYGRAKGCHGEIIFDEATFDIAIAMLRDAKWQLYKDDSNEWCHTCPACVEHKKREAFEKFKRNNSDV